jgi:MoaA/NifB/PqqE/SkfB family radical SAM enzyme
MYSQIKQLHIELSSGCNALCPICARHIEFDNKRYLNKRIPYNQNLTVDDIDNILDSQNVSEDVAVNLCGNHGDPLWNKDIINIVKRVIYRRPIASLSVYTNGSLGKKDTWKQLAKYFTGTHSRGKVCRIISFSIDGLEDTNHIYRRNVKWNKVMENLRTFTSSGGVAEWKYIPFKHNTHQIEEARTLAKQLGFKEFRVDDEQNSMNFKFDIPKIQTVKEKIDRNVEDNKEYSGFVDSPMCKREKTIYISADGLVFPCCHFGSWIYEADNQKRDEIKSIFKIKSIREESFHSIVNNKLWNTLNNSIEKNPIEICIQECGKFS